MLNQLKIDRSPILMATSDYLPVIQIIKNEPQTAVSLSFELISVVHPVHQLDDCPHHSDTQVNTCGLHDK